MTVCITGWRSQIAVEFRALVTEECVWGKPLEHEFPAAGRYLFCHGLLRSKPLDDQTAAERDEGWLVNYISTATQCDWILRSNPTARICIIGSESAYQDSYDGCYAMAKRAIHGYVEGKRLRHAGQQLVAISPGIIEDCGMTTRRQDRQNLERRRNAQRRGRFALAREVAELARFLLYDAPYISGTVVRMREE